MEQKNGDTQSFNAMSPRENEIKEILDKVYQSLMIKGYDPINQMSGYIMTGDPTYITNYNSARSLITKIDRNELLNIMIRRYLGLK